MLAYAALAMFCLALATLLGYAGTTSPDRTGVSTLITYAASLGALVSGGYAAVVVATWYA